MIFLDDTTTSLEIDLTNVVTTNQLPFVASYVDVSTVSFAMSGAAANTGTSNSTTAVTAVAAPGADTTRQIKYFSWKNSDTVAQEGWVQLNENGTLREIWKGTLAVGDTLVYMDGSGWSVINSSGAIKNTFANTFTATRVPFAGSDGILTTDSGFTFNTTGDILTVGAINLAGSTAPTIGFYTPSADVIRTPNSVIVDDNLTVSGTGPHAIGGASSVIRALNLTGAFTGAGGATVGVTVQHTLTGNANDVIYGLQVAPTLIEASSGVHSILTGFLVGAVFTNAGATATIGTNIYVQNPALPAGTTNGTSVYISGESSGATNNYALWVEAGSVRIDGTDGAGAGAGTLTTAPSAGDPDKWIPINSDGTQYWVPAWSA